MTQTRLAAVFPIRRGSHYTENQIILHEQKSGIKLNISTVPALAFLCPLWNLRLFIFSLCFLFL